MATQIQRLAATLPIEYEALDWQDQFDAEQVEGVGLGEVVAVLHERPLRDRDGLRPPGSWDDLERRSRGAPEDDAKYRSAIAAWRALYGDREPDLAWEKRWSELQGWRKDLEDLVLCERAFAALRDDPSLDRRVGVFDAPWPEHPEVGGSGEVGGSTASALYLERADRFFDDYCRRDAAAGFSLDSGTLVAHDESAWTMALRGTVSLMGPPGLRELLAEGSLRQRLVDIRHDRVGTEKRDVGTRAGQDLDQSRGAVTLVDGYSYVTLDFDLVRSIVEWIGREQRPELVEELTLASPCDRGTGSTCRVRRRGELVVIPQTVAREQGEIVAHPDFFHQLSGWILREDSLGRPRP